MQMSLEIKPRTKKAPFGQRIIVLYIPFDKLVSGVAANTIMLFKYNQAMAQIEVKRLRDFPEYQSEVIVRGEKVTKHRVTVTQDYYDQLTEGAVSPEKLVEESFEFLLAREPHTSILSKFDLAVISTYFPEYVQEMKRNFQSR